MQWERSNVIGLAKASCSFCHGYGMRPVLRGTEAPCDCVFRAVFRACYRRFRECVALGAHTNAVTWERCGGPRGYRPYSRVREEFMADFCLVSQRTARGPRLSLAFAQVMLGKAEVSQFSPLQFLIDNLNSSAYGGVAMPFLVELARDSGVRSSLYPALPGATKDEKIGLARVLARSGDQQSVPALQKLSADKDPDVAQEGLRALRTLQAKL